MTAYSPEIHELAEKERRYKQRGQRSDSPQCERLQKERARLYEAGILGEITERDAEAILELTNAYDETEFDTPAPVDETGQKERHREPSTLSLWCQRLRLAATDSETELVEADVDVLNRLTKYLLNEKETRYGGRGLARNTVRGAQDSLRVFYRYHDGLDVDPERIATVSRDSSSIDPSDMLTGKEIERAREAAEHPRDLAVLDLFLYTGQRNMAIRSLRIKDIDLENSRYRLNTEMDGLKRADENGEWRPLLLAKASVQDWLRYHPYSDDPDAYLLTAKPNYNEVKPYQMLARNALSRVTNKIKEEAGIGKPMHPHALRHNFVTLAKREYGIDDATIKYLIGHSASSDIMETTYQHLSDEDHNRAAEKALGLRESEDESSLTPVACPQCGDPLPGNAKACHCGLVITPDAQTTMDDADHDVKQSYAEMDPEDSDTQDKLHRLDDLLDDPEVKAALLDKLADE